MDSASDEPRSDTSEPASVDRLDSWKEIAAYLRRSVRTAKRWEAGEGLPVRRHMHANRSTVYAYSSELDAWWNNRKAALGEREAAESAPLLSPRSLKTALTAGGLVVAALAVGGVWWLTGLGSRPIPFQERDWVLVADFENRTGEPLFDGTLEYALERELANSRHVNVVPRERVQDVLQLMQRPPDTTIDADLGREICLRDGEIRALLTGRVEKLGSAYQLTVELVNPAEGQMVASVSEQAAGQDEVLPALGRMSSKVRRILGDRLRHFQRSDLELEKFTTPSLRALQLVSQTRPLMNYRGAAAAEELLREAVAEDPEFAAAHRSLAWVIRRQGNRPEEDWRPHAETAFRLSERTSGRERYLIRFNYYNMTGQIEKARATIGALRSLYPDAGLDFLANDSLRLGQPLEAAEYQARAADLRPKNFDRNYWAAKLLLAVGRPAESEPYRLRAEELVSREVIRQNPWRATQVRLLPVYGLWMEGEVGQALQRLAEFVAEVDGTAEEERYSAVVSSCYELLGRLREAEEWDRLITDPRDGHLGLARIAYLRGDTETMGRHLLAVMEAPGARMLRMPNLLVRAGLVSQAEQEIAVLERIRPFRPNYFDIARGEIALARGQREEAIALLQRGLQSAGFPSSGAHLMGRESLARALRLEGRFSEALEVLARTPQLQGISELHTDTGIFWMRTQLELARIYREMDRDDDAKEIESELLDLLAVADADHSILLALRGQREAEASSRPDT